MTDWLLAHLPDPRKMLVFYLLNLVVWAVMTVVVMVDSSLRTSLAWVNFISMFALVLGSWGMVTGVLAEIKADPAIEIPAEAVP